MFETLAAYHRPRLSDWTRADHALDRYGVCVCVCVCVCVRVCVYIHIYITAPPICIYIYMATSYLVRSISICIYIRISPKIIYIFSPKITYIYIGILGDVLSCPQHFIATTSANAAASTAPKLDTFATKLKALASLGGSCGASSV